MIADLQLLSFEIGNTCNLAAVHPWCAVNVEGRHHDGHPLTDLEIVSFAGACQRHGFGGLVTWHYYNEPMLHLDRIIRLCGYLQEIGLGCGMWTNGTLIDPKDLEWVRHFSRIWITLHDPSRMEVYRKVEAAAPGKVTLVPGGHDDRLQTYSEGAVSYPSCWRPSHLEMIVDYTGTIHICCADWKAEQEIGSIQRDNFDLLLYRWTAAAIKASCGLLPVCRRCALLDKSPALLDKEFRL